MAAGMSHAPSARLESPSAPIVTFVNPNSRTKASAPGSASSKIFVAVKSGWKIADAREEQPNSNSPEHEPLADNEWKLACVSFRYRLGQYAAGGKHEERERESGTRYARTLRLLSWAVTSTLPCNMGPAHVLPFLMRTPG